MIRAALVLIAIPAFAQEPPPCGPRDDILGDLKSGCGEQVASRGIDGDGRMIEIVANPETGTWSEVTTTGDGMSCLTAAGEGFTVFAILPGEPL